MEVIDELEFYLPSSSTEAQKVTKDEFQKWLGEFFKENPTALDTVRKEIVKVKQAENIVGIDPESWLAKETLWQSRKLIDIEERISFLDPSIKRANKKLERINSDM